MTGYGSAPKVLEKYIPSETRVKETSREHRHHINRYFYSDLTRDMDSKLRELRAREDVRNIRDNRNNEIPGIAMVHPVTWFWTYDGYIYYYIVTRRTEVVRAARTERRSLSDVLTIFRQMECIIRREQSRLRRERLAREAAERERRAAEERARQEAERRRQGQLLERARLERERLAREERAARERRAELERREQELRDAGSNAICLHDLAKRYHSDGVSDYAHAVRIYRKAADLGHRAAAFQVVNLSFNCLHDHSTARIYARKAYELGQRVGLDGAFGVFFREATADLKARDERLAQEAAERAERERRAAAERARLERERQAELERQRRAEEMRGLTANQLNALGCSYSAGKDGKPRDRNHALTLFKSAQAAGLGVASYNVGRYAFYGYGG